MTQHMGMMDFSDEEEKDDEEIVGHLQLLPPLNKTLGWTIREFKDGERRERRYNSQATHNSQANALCPPAYKASKEVAMNSQLLPSRCLSCTTWPNRLDFV